MVNANDLFIQLALVLGLCAIAGFVMKTFRLPLLIGYLLIGILLSSLRFFDLGHSETFNILPGIGIALVMFFVGLELNIRELKTLGRPILVVGLGQIILSSLGGYIMAALLGFPDSEAFLLGVGLAFSSTIVVVKMLLEKQDLKSLHGKLSLGITLLEDLVAIIVLMVLTVGSSFLNLGLQSGLPIVTLLAKGLFLLLLSLVLSRFILTKIFRAVARSQELLFLSAVAWCFVFVAVAVLLGFSVVIGAFLAGLALASSPFHYTIQSKVRPLRDFFVTLFFVFIGSHVVFQDIPSVIGLIVAFTLFVVLIKPILFFLLLGAFGFKKHTIFQVGLGLSEVSEFSLVVMIIGYQLGLVTQAGLTAMALVGVLSIISSSVLISYSKPVYKFVGPFVSWFVRGKYKGEVENTRETTYESNEHVVVVGSHRVGGSIVEFLQKEKIPFIVLDYNPDMVKELMERNIHVIYGDLGDPDIIELLNWEKAKLIVSTAPNLEDNLLLLSEVRKRKGDSIVVVRAANVDDAKLLYDKGADYVILPEIVSGDYLTEIIKTNWPSMGFFNDRKDKELNKLERERLAFESL